MHHVGVALHHQLRHLHRTDFGNAPHVVAPQVDQHHVLGPLLGIGQQFTLKAQVRRLVLAAGSGPAIGRSVTSRPSSRTITSGEAPTRV